MLEQLAIEYAFLPAAGASLQRAATERHWHETMNVQRMLEQVLFCLTQRKDTLQNRALLSFLDVPNVELFLDAVQAAYGSHYLPKIKQS